MGHHGPNGRAGGEEKVEERANDTSHECGALLISFAKKWVGRPDRQCALNSFSFFESFICLQ